jgi:hypothetical protein
MKRRNRGRSVGKMSKSDLERLSEALASVGLRCEVPARGEGLRTIARAHGVPEDLQVGGALELANGDMMFFDAEGRYVGMGSAVDEPPLFWPRGLGHPVAGDRDPGALIDLG